MFYAINLRRLKKPTALLAALSVIVFLGICLINKLYPVKYLDIVREKASHYGIPTAVVLAVIKAESGFDENAQSTKGASGLMQIIKQTGDWAAEEIGIEGYDYDRIFEPEMNIEIGCWYISKLLGQYGNNIDTAIAAYNAGSGNVSKWLDEQNGEGELSDIPFPETKKYLSKVKRNIKVYEILLKIYEI